MKNIPLYDVRAIKDIRDMLNSSAALYSKNTAFLIKQKGDDSYHPVTYSKLKSDVDSFGTALINLGLKNKRIALTSESRYEWAVSYLATVCGTGVVVPLDKELPPHEIESLISRAKIDAIIYSSQTRDHIAQSLQKNNLIKYYIDMDDNKDDSDKTFSFSALLSKGADLIKSGDNSFIQSEIDGEALSVLLFTSATTDKSKAVMLSHSNIASNLMSMCTMINIYSNDIFLSVLPIHHTYECTCGFLCPLYRGASIAICEGLRHIPKNLQESHATIMLGVPLIFEAIYRRIWDQASKKPGMTRKLKFAIKISNLLRKISIDITKKLFAPVHSNFGGHLRLFISGAAGIDPHVAKGFRELGITLIQGYGLTECSPIVALNRDVDYKDSAAGLPLPNLEVKIADSSTDGIGEIWVKGPSIMSGYYENEEATNLAFEDGWFRTGDLGYMDSGKFVYITGRKKNVIVTKNGKNIYPEEIETLLNRSPYIKESLVYGKDDEVYGDTVVSAIIVPDMEKIQEGNGTDTLSPEDIKALIHKEVKSINKGLVIYKYIKDFELREEEFAKTTTKKIKRYMEQQK